MIFLSDGDHLSNKLVQPASDQEACIAVIAELLLCFLIILFLGTKWVDNVVHACAVDIYVLLSPELLDLNGMCLMPQESMSCLVDD